MKIRVLAIGPYDIEKVVMEVAEEYPELHLIYLTYLYENEVIKIVKEYEEAYEIILFAGSLPYHIVNRHLKINKPMFYIPFEGTALYRVLFKLTVDPKFNLQYQSLKMSIDNLQKYEVEESLSELEIKVHKTYYYDDQDKYDLENMVRFHYELWKNEQIQVAITCVGSVYEKLVKLGVPTLRIIPTRSAIRNRLQLVLATARSLREQESQIAIGIIDLEHIFKQDHLTDYQLERRLLALKHIFVDYGEKSQSIIKWTDRREMKFITTRGALKLGQIDSTENKLLNDIFQQTDMQANMGIGIGKTANEAELHAREALKKAKKTNTNYYIYDENGEIYGPTRGTSPISYSLRNDNKQLLDLAEKANVSVSTINRLLSFFDVHGKTTVNANELASGLGITLRSARRLLNKLEQAELVAVTGQEQPAHRGRPRQIYSLNFDSWLIKDVN